MEINELINELNKILNNSLFDGETLNIVLNKITNETENKSELIAVLEEYMPRLITYSKKHYSSRVFSKTISNLIKKDEDIYLLVNNHLLEYLSLMDSKGIITLVHNTNEQLNILNKINTNFNECISSIDSEALITLYYLYGLDKTLSEENKLKINTIIENNKYLFGRIIDATGNTKEGKDLSGIIIKIIDEILVDQNLTYKDISLIGKGAFSNAYLIGDKILKIGDTRETHIIPNNKRILNPLIRINLSDFGNLTGSIEVSNKVDTNIDLSEEELYELYKELRDQGIIFADIKNSNLGYLLKDNTYHWNNTISEDPASRGLKGEQSDVLQTGDIVIIDTDYLYYENDPNKCLVSELSHKFELRYKEEIKTR